MAETDFACSTGPCGPAGIRPSPLGRNRAARPRTETGPAWPARTDQRERCIVFDAMDEVVPLLRGDGREAALELLRAAEQAWKRRCDEIEGDPVEIALRLHRGGYLRRRFTPRTLRQGCKLLSRVCPDLLVDVGAGRYCFPFTEFKDPASARLERLERWRRAKLAEWRANSACGRRLELENREVRSGLKGNARAIPFPRSYQILGSTESGEGGGPGDGSLEARTVAAWRDLGRLGPAIEGQGGDRRTFVACCIPTDYDLPDDVADELLERWGQRCIPRWSPREFFKKKGSAARNRKRPIGYKAPGLAHFPDRRRDSAGARSAAWTSAQGWWDELPSLATLEATGPVEWLMSRGIDPKIAAERDLGRVLPGFGRKLPRWATIGGKTWAEAGIRLVLPVYDASGELAGVRGRWTGPAGVAEAPEDGPGELEARAKEVAPWGQRSAGLVFANAAGRAMLRGEGVSDVVTVVEGGADFLTLATLTDAPVIGVFAGSWTAELAARVPNGAQVLLATHADRVGEGYARQVAATLLRRCEVARLRLPLGCDLNDMHRRGELATAEHELLEAIDLEVPMELLERPGLCAWDRRALVMLARYGQRFRGGARELARVLLTVAERPLEAVAVKALARALVRLSERRELPAGVVVQASAAERAELELDVGGEVGERDPDAAGQAGEPAVPPVAAHGAGRGPLGQGAAGEAGDEDVHLSEAIRVGGLALGCVQKPSKRANSESGQRDAEAELNAAGADEGRVFELGQGDDVDLVHRDFKPESTVRPSRGAPLELAELAERVDRGAPPEGGGTVRAAAENELMRALARATVAVRDRLKRRGRDGPS